MVKPLANRMPSRQPAQRHGRALIIEQCRAVGTYGQLRSGGQRMPRCRHGLRPSYGRQLRML